MDSGNAFDLLIRDERFQANLAELGRLTGQEVGGVLKKSAPTLARYLAEATLPVANLNLGQPDGGSLKARDLGRGAVRREIKRVYVSPSAVYKELQTKKGQVVAKSFYAKIKQGDLPGAKEICIQAGVNAARLDFMAWDGGKHHEASRKKGRVPKGTIPSVVSDAAMLKGYCKRKESHVGFAKSGWITAGDMVQKVSRVGQWIRRNAGPGTGVDDTNHPENPSFSLANQVGYITDIFSGRYEDRAYRSYLHSLDEQINTRLLKLLEKEERKANGFLRAA